MDIKKLKPVSNNVIIKILHADRDGLFEKTITRDDGKTIKLLVKTDLRVLKDDDGAEFIRSLGEADDGRNSYFVSTGIVINTGDNVKNIKPGDIAVLDYNIDNRDDLIIGKDREGKFVSICGVTTFYQEDVIENAQRNSPRPRDQVVAFKGEITRLTDIIGVIRDEKIYAINPYVILSNAPTQYQSKIKGIIRTVSETIIRRKVIAIPDELQEELDVRAGDEIFIKDEYCFDIVLETGVMTGCYAEDIMAKVIP